MPFPIAYLIDRPAPSETYIRREIDQLRRNGWPVSDCTLVGGEQPLSPRVANCPADRRMPFVCASFSRLCEELPRSPASACRMLKRLPQAATFARRASECGAALLHAHFAGITADIVAVAAEALDLPWTCSVHARDVFTSSPRALFRRLRSARGVAACSAKAADAVARCGYPADNIALIHHGLPLDEYPFGARRSDGAIIAAARLEPKKGIDTLVQACAVLSGQGVPFRCVIAGDGSQREPLSSLVRRLGLEASVSLVGWKSPGELKDLLAEASVLAVPSRRTPQGDSDGIPNVLVEALALGTPVVTTGAGAALEAVAHGQNGLVVAPDRADELAAALARLLTSDELRAQLAAEGRKTAERLFDACETTRQLEAFFARAVTR